MVKEDRFAFRLDADDRRKLEEIARRLQRSQGDALRWLIRKAARGLVIGGELEPDKRGKL